MRSALLAVAGRPVVCSACGRPMFRAIAFVHRGRIKLYGADEHDVRVAFSAPDTLELRHLALDRCPAAERPWAR